MTPKFLELRGNQFAPALEREFQANYYAEIRNALRVVALLVAALLSVNTYLESHSPAPYDLALSVPQIAFWLALLGLTWLPAFGRVWQPLLVLMGWAAAFLALNGLAHGLAEEVLSRENVGPEAVTVAQQKFYFVVEFAVLLLSLSTLRLQFRAALLLYGGAMLIGLYSVLTVLPPAPDPLLDVHFVLLPALLVLFVLLLASFVQERLARKTFLANHLLQEERNDERRRREATEGKLHVLAQAIGGIVHDLGNPLTTVQMGASTLDLLLDNNAEPETLREFTAMIASGATMLNYLRLSLIEETRVLEGKPIPVDVKPVSLHAILAAGAQFQKPSLRGKREIKIEGDDALLCADEMKMITVFMNLIANALKYSDGKVCVRWREIQSETQKLLLIAVCDQGKVGQGISQTQAEKLFTAFGRLENHAAIEGTGLGLLSVRKIVEAHGGEAFIEGYQSGQAASAPFSTAAAAYPSMLQSGELTAFVVMCPAA